MCDGNAVELNKLEDIFAGIATGVARGGSLACDAHVLCAAHNCASTLGALVPKNNAQSYETQLK